MRIQYVTVVGVLVLIAVQFIPLSISLPATSIDAQHWFCPDDCMELLADFVDEGVLCAFYDIDPEFAQRLVAKGASIVLDRQNHARRVLPEEVVAVSSRGQMHHKFCIKNDFVFFGSMNPTSGGLTHPNDMVLIEDSKLAFAFTDEYYRLLRKDVARPRVTSGNAEVCFSPAGNCIDRYIELIAAANESIVMGAFSLTHPRIAQWLSIRHHDGIDVTVVVDRRQCHTYCIADALEDQGIVVYRYAQGGIFHHKFMVIDDEILVTGSMNPTKNGNLRNDEHMVIIHDSRLAKHYSSYVAALLLS